MRSFRDSKNRTWTVEITVGAVKSVKALVGVNLLDTQKVLVLDVIEIIDTLYVLCKSQADQLGITDEDFGAGFGGDTLKEAVEVFQEAYIDFFPEARTRALLKRTLDRVKTAETDHLDKIETKLDAKIDQALKKFFADSTELPDSLESTLDPSQSAN